MSVVRLRQVEFARAGHGVDPALHQDHRHGMEEPPRPAVTYAG